MIVVKISDGLGNQMFQYAMGRSVALKRGEVLKFDTSAFNKNYKLRSYLLEKFNIVHSELTIFEKIIYIGFYNYTNKILNKIKLSKVSFSNMYKEKNVYKFDKKVFVTDSNYFLGYWQDYRYFKDIKSSLLKEFTLKEEPNAKNQNMLKNIKNTNAISVHIRRGDFLSIVGQEVCSLEYYKKAVRYINDFVDNPVFYIFSDDTTWAKKNLYIENPIIYIDFNSTCPEWDLELMRNCKHNIIANSSFSWWGAWLNRNESKIVISPREWKIGRYTPTGFIAENWILL